jgi:transcriptional regulator with XRE-family HTH domain
MLPSLGRRKIMEEIRQLCPEVEMLKEFKERHGLTMDDLAKALGVKTRAIYSWLHGEREPGSSSKTAIRFLVMLEKSRGIRIDKNIVSNV